MAPKRKAGAKAKAEQGPIITGAQALQLKAALDAGQQLDDETLLELLHANTPCESLYSKACKSKGTNPNCLCNLIPAPDAHRRSGLWAKNADGSAALGPDPSATKREDTSKPVGLRNLGNTCYVNSVLQCLFANRPFRHAVFATTSPLSEDPVVKVVKELFVQMLCGATDPVDPAALATALQLDHAVQQDGQEFMKLFLTLLEQKFSEQRELRDVIQGMYRGQLGYETVCQACHSPSESSKRSDTFYELDIPVRGFVSLEESLGSLLAPELLDGDNQYHCDKCAGKRDATRQLRVRSLPPLLCLSLQRFVFDMVKLDRVKVSDKFSFPLELRGSALSDDPAARQAVYDLEAILIHKGTSAIHGHYVAHIRVPGDDTSGKGTWWRFDDESVSEMKSGPLHSSDHGGAGPGQAASKLKKGEGAGKGKSTNGGGRGGRGKAAKGGRGRGKGRGGGRSKKADAWEGSDGEPEEIEIDLEGSDEDLKAAVKASKADMKGADDVVEEVQGGGSADGRHITSTNAYLLLYRQRGADLGSVELAPEVAQWLEMEKERLHAEFNERAATYATAKAEAASRQEARRVEVRSLVESAANMPPNDPGRFISSTWLQEWADAEAAAPPGPIDNAPLLCPHGKLDPARTTAMRRIPTHAWEQLVSLCRGGPELAPSDTCAVCLGDQLTAVAAAEDSQEARDRFLAVAAALEDQEDAEGLEGEDGVEGVGAPAYFVAKSWLGGWRRRLGRSMGFSPPTAAITCPHGALAPESLTKHSKRIAIPADFWAFLQRSWQLAELERERKVRARRAAAARKADGGAAVIDATPVKKQEDREGDGGNDVVMMDAEDGKTGASLPEVVDIHDDEDEVLEGPSEKKGGIDAEAEHANGNGNGNVDDTGTGSEPLHEFPITSDECPVCLSEMHAAASLSKGLHSRREAERADLAHLVNPTLVNLTPGQSYRLVPAAFMHLWRAYMAQAGGRGATSASTPGEVVQPPSLVASMAGVACSCHPGPPDGPLLAHPPPGVVNRRGRWVLANEEEGAFEVVSVSDWEAIVIHYLEDGMAFGPEGIQATLLVDTLPGPPAAPAPGEAGGANGIPAAAGPSSNPSGTISMADISPEKGSDMLESKEQGPGGSKAGETAISPSVGAVLGEPDVIFGGDGDANPYDARPRGMAARAAAAGYGWLEPHPAVCAAAVAQREEAAKAARLTYVAQEVMVETCPTDEEAKAATAAAAAAAAAGADGADVGGAERRSKRARKGRAPVVVDCTTTLCDLRLRIFEALGVHPRNARLFLRGKVLEAGDDSTMAGCEIYPGEEIRVVDTGEHDANDLVGLFPGGARREGRETRQEGFGGTALVSHTGAGSAKAQKEELLSPSDNEQR